MFKVQLEEGVWLADVHGSQEGDPARTYREELAKEFEDMNEAFEALADAREFRPFKDAEVVEDIFE